MEMGVFSPFYGWGNLFKEVKSFGQGRTTRRWQNRNSECPSSVFSLACFSPSLPSFFFPCLMTMGILLAAKEWRTLLQRLIKQCPYSRSSSSDCQRGCCRHTGWTAFRNGGLFHFTGYLASLCLPESPPPLLHTISSALSRGCQPQWKTVVRWLPEITWGQDLFIYYCSFSGNLRILLPWSL